MAIEDFVIKDGVLEKYVGKDEKVIVPNGVSAIKSEAFRGCSMKSVVLPESVKEIYVYSFKEQCEVLYDTGNGTRRVGCMMINGIKIFDDIQECWMEMYYGTEKELLIPKVVQTIYREEGFQGPVNESVEVIRFEPDGKCRIDNSAFEYYRNIRYVDISNSVTEIGADAFAGQPIEEVVLSDSLIKMESEAFRGCKKLKKVSIPDSVTEIGNGCFNGCIELKQIECSEANLDRFVASFNAKNKPKVISDILSGTMKCNSGFGKTTLKFIEKKQKDLFDMIIADDNDLAVGALLALPININKSLVESYIKTAKAKVSAVLLNYENSLGNGKQIDDLSLTMEEPKERTLAEWKNIYKLKNIGDSEISIGAYQGNETSVAIPKMIGKRKVVETVATFEGKNEITEVYLPDSIKSIGEKTFSQCSSLRFISIPTKLKTIGYDAFKGCSSLVEISVPKGVTVIDGGAFEDCINIRKIVIPDSVKMFGKKGEGVGIFRGCINLEYIELPPKLKIIPWNAFDKCTNLLEIELPEGMKEIGMFAFNGCTRLEKIVIPASVEKIDFDAFDGCDKLKIYTPLGSVADQYAKRKDIPVVNIES